jgi:hypothetical protein
MLIAPGGVISHFGEKQAASIRIPDSSIYKPFAKQVLRRAEIPQENGMPTRKFSEIVSKECLKERPREYLSIGKLSIIFYFLSWLPLW